jgi:glyoxylase-like metal-dependent hydrolase (beta-lactamase superfamily II)
LLHVADAVRHPVQMAHPDWNGSLDSFPAESVATRRRLLSQAAQDRSLLFAAHLPFPGVGWVEAKGDSWTWRPMTLQNTDRKGTL